MGGYHALESRVVRENVSVCLFYVWKSKSPAPFVPQKKKEKRQTQTERKVPEAQPPMYSCNFSVTQCFSKGEARCACVYDCVLQTVSAVCIPFKKRLAHHELI